MKLIEVIKTEEEYCGKVYDLSIIDDNSYCVNGIIVHNCGCITSSNSAIHYPMASLINEIYQEKINTYRHNNFLNKTWNEIPKIIADGGVRNYSDVIKSYALGSDYVMIGSVFASLI